MDPPTRRESLAARLEAATQDTALAIQAALDARARGDRREETAAAQRYLDALGRRDRLGRQIDAMEVMR